MARHKQFAVFSGFVLPITIVANAGLPGSEAIYAIQEVGCEIQAPECATVLGDPKKLYEKRQRHRKTHNKKRKLHQSGICSVPSNNRRPVFPSKFEHIWCPQAVVSSSHHFGIRTTRYLSVVANPIKLYVSKKRSTSKKKLDWAILARCRKAGYPIMLGMKR
jgi:hypothetical protein